MNKIVGNRKTGKTSELIRYCAKTDAYIVVKNSVEVRRVIEYATNDMKVKIRFPMTYDELLNSRGTYPSVKFCIDDIEAFLAHLNRKIAAFTMDAPCELQIWRT